jgi:spermidine synthase
VSAVLYLVFFLSGAAALLFETLWFNQAGLALGKSVWASSIVLAGFMGGLALGNGLAARFGPRLRRPVVAYAGLELAIAATGVALVFGIPHLGPALAPVLGPLVDRPLASNAIRLAVAFALLLVPSTAMGITLPLLVGELSRGDAGYGRVLGRLYGWNTLGAVVGAISGDALLFERFGLRGSALVAGGLNLAAAALALTLGRSAAREAIARAPAPTARPALPRSARAILAAAALCGATLLALEVVWFRFLILFTLPGSLAFALMLAVVLAGIGAGGLVAARILARTPSIERALAALAFAAGTLVVATYLGFGPVASRVLPGQSWWTVVILGLVLMFPVSLASGVLFAGLGAALQERAPAEIRNTGLLTLANTTGAMLGSLAGGFVLLPGLGIERSLRLLAGAYGAAAVVLVLAGVAPRGVRGRAVLAAAWIGLTLAVGPGFPAGLLDQHYLLNPLQIFAAAGERPVLFRETLTETAIYTRWDLLGQVRHYRLVTNSHSMSTTSFQAQRYMRHFVYLPLALHPAPKDALLISYGVGVTAKALTDSRELARIDVVDISREILEMNRIVWDDPRDYPLDDPRVHVHIEDGRHYLQTTERRFDVITGEPPPPKAAGIVNLYTREFFALAKARLAPRGLFTYWLPVHVFSEAETRSVIRGFCDAFPDCSLWSGGGLNWLLLGTNEARGPGSAERFARQWRDPRVGPSLRALGFERPELLATTFLADAAQLARMTRGALPLVDDHPKRIGQRMMEPAGQIATYRTFHEPGLVRDRFEASAWLREILPPAIREATLPYFEAQGRIEEYFWTGAGENRRVEVDLPRVDRVLRETPLETLALWEMRTNADIQRPVAKAAAAGRRGPFVDFEAGASALAARRFAEAATRFRSSWAQQPSDRTALVYAVYALCMAGDPAGGLALAARGGLATSAAAADAESWRFLERRCEEGPAIAPASAIPPDGASRAP